jgi:hypothetical protein
MRVGGHCHAPAAFTLRKVTPLPIVQEAGWGPGIVWTGAENLAHTGIRSPDHPARRELLYRLRYPGPQEYANIRIILSLNLKNESVKSWIGFFSLKVESSGGM